MSDPLRDPMVCWSAGSIGCGLFNVEHYPDTGTGADTGADAGADADTDAGTGTGSW